MVKLTQGPAIITEEFACSLESVLQEGPIPVRCAVRISYQIASAIAFLHSRRLCHGSVDVANVVMIKRTLTDPTANRADLMSGGG